MPTPLGRRVVGYSGWPTAGRHLTGAPLDRRGVDVLAGCADEHAVLAGTEQLTGCVWPLVIVEFAAIALKSSSICP
jgi:hypothetical protein